jgi:threonylcarbamoyladenosine tRNA methylthiotransferase MtaB
VVPYARGPSRSRSVDRILKEAEGLVRKGYKEIVLTGTHIGLYGKDAGVEGIHRFPSLPDVVRRVSEIDGLIRLRISSLEPHDVGDELLDCLRLPQVCAHLHLPLQSGSDKVLRAMGRRYDVSAFRDVVDKTRRIAPNAGITTDIIVGFPGETENDFEETLSVAKQIRFSRIHAFKFSARPGTRARDLADKVGEKEKDERVNRLISTGLELSLAFHRKHVGRTVEVLAEDDRTSGGLLSGITRNYIRCNFAGGDEYKGAIVPVFVREARESSVSCDIALPANLTKQVV